MEESLKCEDCKWWQGEVPFERDWKRCQHDEVPSMVDQDIEFGTGSGAMETYKNFGCIYFEKRDEQVQE